MSSDNGGSFTIIWKCIRRIGATNGQRQIPEVWTIPVLCSAIINSDLVNTSADVKRALRLLSNTPIASQVEQYRYSQFMTDLRESYSVLLQGIDDVQAIWTELEAIQRKK